MKKKTYTLKEILEAIATLSRGGHPDDFIPYDAKIKLVKGKIVIEWTE